MVTTRFTDFRANKKSRTGVGFFGISEEINSSNRPTASFFADFLSLSAPQ